MSKRYDQLDLNDRSEPEFPFKPFFCVREPSTAFIAAGFRPRCHVLTLGILVSNQIVLPAFTRETIGQTLESLTPSQSFQPFNADR